MATNPFEVQSSGNGKALQLPIALAFAVGGVLLGGYLCGCAIDKFGSLGALSIWALGGGLGWAATKFLSRSQTIGYVLGAAVILAFFVAEICWIKWNIIGMDTWIDATTKLPWFFQTYVSDSIISGLITFFGARSAFAQARGY